MKGICEYTHCLKKHETTGLIYDGDTFFASKITDPTDTLFRCPSCNKMLTVFQEPKSESNFILFLKKNKFIVFISFVIIIFMALVATKVINTDSFIQRVVSFFEKKETDTISDDSSNFDGFAKKDYDDGVYEGEWENGLRNGDGKFTYNKNHRLYTDDNLIITLEGEWVNDKKEGEFTAIDDKGNKYTGTLLNDTGTLYFGEIPLYITELD